MLTQDSFIRIKFDPYRGLRVAQASAATRLTRLQGPADIFTIPKGVLTAAVSIATVDCISATSDSSARHDRLGTSLIHIPIILAKV